MKIPFSPPDLTELEINEVVDTLKSGWITTGPKTKKLESLLAEYVGTNKTGCLNSQTAAGEMSLRLLGIGEGDEVITCAYTYSATASVIDHVGAKIVLVDCQKESLEMDYDALENAITEKTKAVIPVDLAGIPCDYDRIFEIVEKKKNLFTPKSHTEFGQRLQEAIGRVAVITDAAHSLGASYKGKMVMENWKKNGRLIAGFNKKSGIEKKSNIVVSLPYYFRVNFSGFSGIIDALGGITVHSDFTAGQYSYHVGENHLNGEQALAFARERYSFSEGDRQRGRNQMAVIKAVIQKAVSTELLKNFSSILKAVEGTFETSIPMTTITSLISAQLDEGGEWNIVMYSVDGTGDKQKPYSMSQNAYVMIPDQTTVEKAKELMRQVRDGEVISLDE